MGIIIGDHGELRRIIEDRSAMGETVVFTNGAFDLFHVGHLRALSDARSRGDCLVVAVNSDSSVAAYKGPHLPIVPEEERVEILCGLACVDFVTLFGDTTVDNLLLQLKPQIHAKGRDYTEETVPERETVLSYGGTIAIVGDPKNHSSTNLRERLARAAEYECDARGKRRGGRADDGKEGRGDGGAEGQE